MPSSARRASARSSAARRPVAAIGATVVAALCLWGACASSGQASQRVTAFNPVDCLNTPFACTGDFNIGQILFCVSNPTLCGFPPFGTTTGVPGTTTGLPGVTTGTTTGTTGTTTGTTGLVILPTTTGGTTTGTPTLPAPGQPGSYSWMPDTPGTGGTTIVDPPGAISTATTTGGTTTGGTPGATTGGAGSTSTTGTPAAGANITPPAGNGASLTTQSANSGSPSHDPVDDLILRSLNAGLERMAGSAGDRGINGLLGDGGMGAFFLWRTAGQLSLVWTMPGPATRGQNTKSLVLLAFGTLTRHQAGRARLHVALTAAGRQLLRSGKHVKIDLTAGFVGANGHPNLATTGLQLGRRR